MGEEGWVEDMDETKVGSILGGEEGREGVARVGEVGEVGREACVVGIVQNEV